MEHLSIGHLHEVQRVPSRETQRLPHPQPADRGLGRALPRGPGAPVPRQEGDPGEQPAREAGHDRPPAAAGCTRGRQRAEEQHEGERRRDDEPGWVGA